MPHICPWWFAYTFDNPLRRLFHKPEEIFAGLVAPGMTVADIGCGLGYFSLGLARMVGDTGKVYSVDIQQEMLERMRTRAQRNRLDSIITPILCSAEDLRIPEPLDFALAFWMVHETPDPEFFLKQICHRLKPGGRLLVTEPRFHVSLADFEQEIDSAQKTGLTIGDKPKIAFSYSVVLTKQGNPP